MLSTIRPSDMPTTTTLLTGMLGVHQDYRHPRQPRFVLGEAAQLRKRPARQTSPLRLPERSPTLANPLKVFEGQAPHGVCSSRNEPFTDHVIDIPAKGGFPTRGALEGAANVLGTLAVPLLEMCGPLQPLPPTMVAGTTGVNVGSGIGLRIAGCRQCHRRPDRPR